MNSIIFGKKVVAERMDESIVGAHKCQCHHLPPESSGCLTMEKHGWFRNIRCKTRVKYIEIFKLDNTTTPTNLSACVIEFFFCNT